MSWCPKCNMEYREGITECPDCKVDLVESLEQEVEMVPFLQAEDKKIADKLVRYFEYSEIKSEISFDEVNEVYVVSVPPKKEKEARKLYQAFYYVERDNMLKSDKEHNKPSSKSESEDTSDADDDASTGTSSEEDETDAFYENVEEQSENNEEVEDTLPDEDYEETEERAASTYVMKADQYKDLAGTVWIFLLFGVAGLIIVILNMVDVLNFLNGFISLGVMGALFLTFIYIAYSTNQKAKKVQAEIDAENELTVKINAWLESNVTESYIKELHNDILSDELNYMKLVDTVKDKLVEVFGPQNLAYLDRLIEEYYSNHFDQ